MNPVIVAAAQSLLAPELALASGGARPVSVEPETPSAASAIFVTPTDLAAPDSATLERAVDRRERVEER